MAGIGDLVAHLGVDNTGFKKGLDGASSSLRSFAGNITGIVAPIAGALAGIWGTGAAISGAKESLANQQKLATVLAHTGSAVGMSAEAIADYSDELQSLTNFEGDATVAAATMLASFGNFRGENFKLGIALAQDMATVMGTDLDSAIRKMGKSMADLSPEEVGKKLAEMQSRFGGAAQAVADPWVILQNTLGDVGENIGSVLLPSVNVLAEALTGMIGIVADGAEWFKTIGIESAVVLSNMGGLLTLGATQWRLFFVQIIEGGKHLFTETLPAYLTWFGDNFGNVIFTAVDYGLTLFVNLGQNIRNLWQTTLDFFAGKGVEFNWVPLTEGFKSAIDSLPDVPERLTTEFEKSLQRDIEAMSDDLSTSMDKQRTELEQKFSPLASPKVFQMPETDKEADKNKQSSAAAGKSTLKAAFQGSSEAASIMLRGIGGGGKKIEDIAQKQLVVAQQQLAATKESKQEFKVVDFGAA